MAGMVIVGRVRTMDPARPLAEAIAFRDGLVVAVGPRSRVLEAAPSAEVIEVQDAAVLPGFIDAHHHVSVAALYEGTLRLVPPVVHDVASFQSTLAEASASMPKDRWLVATHWDEQLLRERRAPTRDELDQAVPDRPAFLLHYTCHRALANTKALELAGIDRNTPEPSGGVIARGAGGVPNGLLIERGMSRVEALARAERSKVDASGIVARMAAHYRAIAKAGITRVCDTAVPRDLMALYRILDERHEVLVPTHVCPVSLGGWLEEPLDALDGPGTGERVGALTIGPVKLVFDGAPACSMCLSWGQVLVSTLRTIGISLRHGSLDPFRTMASLVPTLGKDIRTGIAIYRHEDAARVVRSVVERGFSVATHALGNAAIEVALDAYGAAGSTLARGGRPRIEHAAFASKASAKRLADGGIAAVVQPGMLTMPAFASAARIPGLPFFPLKRLLDAGVTLVGSSDYPVIGFDPLLGVVSATRRLDLRGEVIDEAERIDLDAAIAMYTRHAAEVMGCGGETGSLSVGKRADVVVVDGLEDAAPSVRSTFIGGVLV